MSTSPTTVVVINQDGIGSVDEALRHKLIGTYLDLLIESEYDPQAICLYANGVRLAVQGSPVIEALRTLEARGVTILLCSTCLAFFNLRERVEVGIVGGMHDILEFQWRADKVITL